jgi:TPR repeat protein
MLYESGDGGLPQDYTEAMRWYRRSAEQGHADAQYLIATKYESGTANE